MFQLTLTDVAQHVPVLLLLAACIALQVPKYRKRREYLLLSQDYNLVNFGKLYLHDDIPARDDCEVGDNRRSYGTTSSYYWLPMLLHKWFGVPLEFFVGLHALLVPPGLLLGTYVLAFTVWPDPIFGCFAALLFFLNDFSYFTVNHAYPMLAGQMPYYGDANYPFVCLFLAGFLAQQPVVTGLCGAWLVLLNPLLGANALLLQVAYAVLDAGRVLDVAGLAWFLGPPVLACAVAWTAVKAALTKEAPCPAEDRRIAIRSYREISPHAYETANYYLAMAAMLVLGGFALHWEWSAGPQGRVLPLAAGLLYFVGWDIGAYWGAFVKRPELLPVFGPSKALQLMALLVFGHAALGIWMLASGSLAGSLAVVLLYLLCRKRFTITIGKSDVWLAATVGVLAVWGLGSGAPALWPQGAGSGLGVLALMAYMAWDAWKTQCPGRLAKDLEIAADFLDIQERIRDGLDRETVVVPYRLPGVRENFYGFHRCFPFRTFSRRGGLTFWSVGRNAYFNSLRRHNAEVLSYALAGIDFWQSMRRVDESLAADKLPAHAGVSFEKGGVSLLQELPLVSAKKALQDQLRHFCQNAPLPQIMSYANRLGATHVLLVADPGQVPEQATSISIGPQGRTSPSYPIVMRNSRFIVLAVPA